MKKIIKAVLTAVGLCAGAIALGGPASNVADFSWFGRFFLAGLVCCAAFWLLKLINTEPDNSKQVRL